MGSTRTFTRPSAVKPIARVSCHCSGNKEQTNNGGTWLDLAAFSKHARTYATASPKPASRPKAHTGRTPAKRTATTKTTTSTKKKTAKPSKKKAAKKSKPKTRAKKAPSKTSIAQKARKAQLDLRAKAQAAGKKTRFTPIHDDRTVKSRRNAYSFFFAERHSSGDLRGMTVAESGKLLGREWKKM